MKLSDLPKPETIAEVLRHLTDPSHGDRVTLDDAIETLGDRAYGLLMLMLALPMAVPLSAIPGVSTVFGVPLILISLQLMLGRPQPWFPQKIGQKSFARADLSRMIEKALPWLERCERIVRPRWPILTSMVAERLIGAVAAFMAMIMALPIVFGNQPPALTIAIFALALIAKDGLVVIVGLVASVVSTLIVGAVLGSFVAAGWYAFTNFVS